MNILPRFVSTKPALLMHPPDENEKFLIKRSFPEARNFPVKDFSMDSGRNFIVEK